MKPGYGSIGLLAGYYVIVACIAALTRQSVLVIAAGIIPIFVLGGLSTKERRKLVRYLEAHHPNIWHSMASQWQLNKFAGI